MKEASLYKKLRGKKVKCLNCSHYCILQENQRGLCGVRENKNGKLYSLVYGKVSALDIDPIEKKPLFHFLPGTETLSLATAGCQFRCKNCQNWQLSQEIKKEKTIEGKELKPKEIVKIAKKYNLPSISYTYTDPIVFSEYALDIMKLAKKEGIKNIWITSGFWSKELFNFVSPFIDAVNVDIKSSEESFYTENCGGKLKPVLETLKRIKEKGIWIEITTLVIPSLNDKDEIFEKISSFIKKELGRETPWHISKFSGDISWKLQNLPSTPNETLKRAFDIGKKKGLNYVYVGNTSIPNLENTYCPYCNEKIIERKGYFIKRFDKEGKCPKCSKKINLILK
jgi:pyruvate formate lyase activating enzyme